MLIAVLKIATAAQAVIAAVMWGITMAQAETAGASSVSTVLLGVVAAAISGQTGLIAWSYRRMFSGDLVKVDIERLHEASTRREDGYRQMLEASVRREEMAWNQLLKHRGQQS